MASMTTTQSIRSKPNLLIINGHGSIEGDVFTLLLALQNIPSTAFNVFAITIPQGEVYDCLAKIPQVKIIPMKMGGSEADNLRDNNKITRLVDFTTALLRLVGIIWSNKIDIMYTIDRGISPKLQL